MAVDWIRTVITVFLLQEMAPESLTRMAVTRRRRLDRAINHRQLTLDNWQLTLAPVMRPTFKRPPTLHIPEWQRQAQRQHLMSERQTLRACIRPCRICLCKITPRMLSTPWSPLRQMIAGLQALLSLPMRDCRLRKCQPFRRNKVLLLEPSFSITRQQNKRDCRQRP